MPRSEVRCFAAEVPTLDIGQGGLHEPRICEFLLPHLRSDARGQLLSFRIGFHPHEVSRCSHAVAQAQRLDEGVFGLAAQQNSRHLCMRAIIQQQQRSEGGLCCAAFYILITEGKTRTLAEELN